MATKFKSTFRETKIGSRGKKTSQGNHRNIRLSSMNKHKRRSFKAYRGQGR